MKTLEKLGVACVRAFCAGMALAWAWRSWVFRDSLVDAVLGVLMVLGFGILVFLPWRKKPEGGNGKVHLSPEALAKLIREQDADRERARREIAMIRQRELAKREKPSQEAPAAVEKLKRGQHRACGSSAAKILATLEDGKPRSRKEIAEKSGTGYSSLDHAVKNGYVKKDKSGCFRITPQGRAALENYRQVHPDKAMAMGIAQPREEDDGEPVGRLDVWENLARCVDKDGYVSASDLVDAFGYDVLEFVKTWKMGNPAKMIPVRVSYSKDGEEGTIKRVHLARFKEAWREWGAMRDKAGAE